MNFGKIENLFYFIMLPVDREANKIFFGITFEVHGLLIFIYIFK